MRQQIRRWGKLLTLVQLALVLAVGRRAGAEEYALASARPEGEISQVEMLLEVGGDLSMRDEKEKKTHTLKTSVVGTMVYDEKLVTAASNSDQLRGLRRYRRCDAVIKIDKGNTTSRLRDDRRLVAVAAAPAHVTLFSPAGPLTQEE